MMVKDVTKFHKHIWGVGVCLNVCVCVCVCKVSYMNLSFGRGRTPKFGLTWRGCIANNN